MYNYNVEVEYDLEGEEVEKYQTKFLEVMNLKTYNNDEINKVFDYLFKEIGENEYFKNVFNKDYYYSFLGDTKWTVIPILFSYNSFYYTHKCLKEYFTTGKVNEVSLKELNESLNYLLKK